MKVISAGHCDFDSPAIAKLIESCGAECIEVALAKDLKEAIRKHQPKLILLNRIFDADYAKGIELIRELKQDEEFSNIRMMLISNYEESQSEAMDAGALEGFGKAQIGSEIPLLKLKDALK